MAIAPLRLADAPDVLTVAETMRVLRCDRSTVYHLLDSKQIRIPPRVGRRYIIPKYAVEAYLTGSKAKAS